MYYLSECLGNSQQVKHTGVVYGTPVGTYFGKERQRGATAECTADY